MGGNGNGNVLPHSSPHLTYYMNKWVTYVLKVNKFIANYKKDVYNKENINFNM